MKTLVALLVVTAVIAVYVVILRPWLRGQVWAEGYFKLVEPVELWLYSKSESILWSRFLMVFGALPGIMSQIGGFDFTPFIDWIPEKYRPWLFLGVTLCGIVGEALRRDTTKSLDEVALPEEKPIEVEMAVKAVEIKREVAAEVIKEAKAEGKV